MKVNTNVLLQGPWYCLEQCGLLLHAAVTLFEAQQYPAAAALALLAHEELGKHQILIDLWWRAERGAAFDVQRVKDASGDHVKKQRHGQRSVMLRGISAALEKLEELARHKAKRTPDDRHRARMRALYVDLKDSGDGWDRPVYFTRNESHGILEEACNDYGVLYGNLPIWLEDPDSPESESLRAWIGALNGWPERPALPTPKWPA